MMMVQARVGHRKEGRQGGDVQEAKWMAHEADKLGEVGGRHPEGEPHSGLTTGGWQGPC